MDERVSRSAALSRQLESAIVSGSMPSGARLGTKDELRQHYGVAAGTVNEAIRVLQERGLVEIKPGPGGGIFAATPPAKVRLNHLLLGVGERGAEVADCLAVRDALDPLIAAEAAEHCTTSAAVELGKYLDDMTAHQQEPAPYLRANWALHRRLAELTKNRVLQSVYLTLLDYIESELSEVTPDPAFRRQAPLDIDLHRRLVEAVVSRNAVDAAAVAAQHPTVTRGAYRATARRPHR